jgi:hypothetical protein
VCDSVGLKPHQPRTCCVGSDRILWRAQNF